MLKITPDPKFTVDDVSITVPGQKKPATVSITFRYMPKSEQDKWTKRMKGKNDFEALSDLIVEWDGFDVMYTKENLEKLLDNYPLAGREISLAYSSQYFESRIKN